MIMGERQITVDCDVLQADGGTRTAAITGGWVALWLAGQKLVKAKDCIENPIMEHIAAISCGVHNGEVVLDLDYAEDSEAGTDKDPISGAYDVLREALSALRDAGRLPKPKGDTGKDR